MISRKLLMCLVVNEARGALFVIAALLATCHPAHAANVPLNLLTPRGTPIGTDLIPVLPAGGSVLESTTVAQLQAAIGGVGGGTGTLTSLTCGSGLIGGTITTTGTCSLAPLSLGNFGNIGSGDVLGNATALSAAPADTPLSNMFDTAFACSAQGDVLYRGSASWSCLTPGVAGQVLTTEGPAANPVWLGASGLGLAPNLLKFGPPTLLNTVNSAGYYDPQPLGLIDVTDGFTATGNYTKFGTGTFTVSGGTGNLSVSGSNAFSIALTSDTTLVAPQFFNAIEVTAQTPSSGYSNIYAGAFKDINNYVGVYYDAVGHAIHTEYDYSGTIKNSNVKSVTLTPPYVVGASLVGASLNAWYKTTPSGPWLYAGNTQTGANFDYAITANFASAGFKTGALVSLGGSGSFTVSTLQGGRFGGTTVRDLKPVVNADWTTYQPGSNTIDLTASTFDPGGAGGQVVFSMNLNTQTLTQTGTICTQRTVSAVSRTYCGDNAGNIVVHTSGEAAGGTTGDRTVILSSWSSGASNSTPVQVLYQYVTHGSTDILTTNLTVLSSLTQLTLPFGSAGGIGAYDAALAYDAVHGRWLMTYSICNDCTFASTSPQNFYPALAYASAPTGTWTAIAQDTGVMGNWEGTSFANVSGVLYELAGGAGRSLAPGIQQCASSRVYDETFAFLGSILGATFDSAPGGTAEFSCSHPTLFAMPDGVHSAVITFLGGEFVSGNTTTLGQPVIEISTP